MKEDKDQYFETNEYSPGSVYKLNVPPTANSKIASMRSYDSHTGPSRSPDMKLNPKLIPVPQGYEIDDELYNKHRKDAIKSLKESLDVIDILTGESDYDPMYEAVTRSDKGKIRSIKKKIDKKVADGINSYKGTIAYRNNKGVRLLTNLSTTAISALWGPYTLIYAGVYNIMCSIIRAFQAHEWQIVCMFGTRDSDAKAIISDMNKKYASELGDYKLIAIHMSRDMYDCFKTRLQFGDVRDTYVVLVDKKQPEELKKISSFKLSDKARRIIDGKFTKEDEEAIEKIKQEGKLSKEMKESTSIVVGDNQYTISQETYEHALGMMRDKCTNALKFLEASEFDYFDEELYNEAVTNRDRAPVTKVVRDIKKPVYNWFKQNNVSAISTEKELIHSAIISSCGFVSGGIVWTSLSSVLLTLSFIKDLQHHSKSMRWQTICSISIDKKQDIAKIMTQVNNEFKDKLGDYKLIHIKLQKNSKSESTVYVIVVDQKLSDEHRKLSSLKMSADENKALKKVIEDHQNKK